jgi:hypothetical protein
VEPVIGGALLTFDNAAIRLQAAQPGASYKLRWKALDNLARTARRSATKSRSTDLCAGAGGGVGAADDTGAAMRWRRFAPSTPPSRRGIARSR